MTALPSPPFQDAADAAAWWRVRMDDPSATESDWAALESWLSESEENRAAYAALDLAVIDAEEALRGAPSGSNVTPFRRVLARPAVWATAVAATLAIAVLVPALAPRPNVQLAYAAPADMDRQVALPDGTEISLNRGAAIRVSLGATRQVKLDRGEASFTVRHDATRPFEVAVNGVTIRDIGTRFNVAPRGRGVVVTVSEGLVGIGESKTRVAAGERATIGSDGQVLVTATPHPEDAFAWRTGQLVYHDATVAEIVDDLRAYGARNIHLDPAAERLRFSGVLAIDEPRLMLARLETFMPIRVRDERDGIVVRSR